MNTFIEKILDTPALTISHYKDEQGVSYYEGTSEKYRPYIAVSKNAMQCLLKFHISLDEQKRLSAYLKK